MYVKLYGAKEQKKLAEYPNRIMRVQQFQETIPKIEDLDLDRTTDLDARIKRFLKELSSYEVIMRATINRYKKIIEEAKADCDSFEQLIMDAPKSITEGRKFSLMTSVVQTKQQILIVEQQCVSLESQIKNIETTKVALRTALTQNNLANLAHLIAELKRCDTEIRNSPK